MKKNFMDTKHKSYQEYIQLSLETEKERQS